MVAQPELVTEGCDLGLQWTLADGDQAERNAAIDEEPARPEERWVVLLRPHVGHRADHDLVGAQPELLADGLSLAGRQSAGPLDVDAVDQHLGALGGRATQARRRLAR